MKLPIRICAAVAVLLFAVEINAQVSGTVFRDFNASGAKENTASYNEPFAVGITVKAFNSGGIQLGATKTTDIAGAYSFTVAEIPSGTAVRIEFSGLGTGEYSSFNGTANGTNVQFVTAPATTVNYAVSSPDDYWNNVSEANPILVVAKNKRGRYDGVYNGFASIIQINDNTQSTSPPANSSVVTIDTGQTTAARRASTYGQTGSVFGMALQRKSQRTFTTAVLKRGHGFGPRGAGGIYIASKGATYLAYSGSFTLQGVTPSNGGAALDFGTVTRTQAAIPDAPTAGEMAGNNYLSGNWAWSVAGGSDSRDNDAFAKVGTMSYGDIEADVATDKLYTINLFQRRLVVLDVENVATATLNGASAATLSSYVRAYDLTALSGWPAPTGAGNVVRPYGVKVYRGVGYIGVVSDASATQNRSHLVGYILSFDPNNIPAGLTTVLTINFSQYGLLFSTNTHMGPWVSTWAQAMTQSGAGAPGPTYYAQPMIAGIEFNEDGSMDIAIRDRWGDQGSSFEFTAETNSTNHQQTVTMGDLLHAPKSGTGWVLESTTTQPAANTNGSSATNSFGEGSSFTNSGKEYYADRSGDSEPENNEAGVTKLIGSQRIVTSVVDPCSQGADVSGSIYWSTQGVQWSNVTTGNKSQWARLEGDATTDKSNGMGDVEFLVSGQPIQIGNRIWNDVNGNGVQDAGETTAGVPTGTTVTLRSPGIDGIYGNGDDQTWTTTTDANGNYYFSALSSADNRKPATWAGVGNTLLPGYNYRVEVAVPTGYQITLTDAVTNTVDNIDNDASLNGANAVVAFNTSNTNHNYDIGFTNLAKLGDKVWRDDDKDGIQDTDEPGVAGVTVTLYQNGPDGVPGTADDVVVGTTVTDAYGNYLFDNLAPSTNNATQYSVGFTPPANYQFTIQTNTQTTGSSNATNVTNTSGGSTAANGSDANATTGRTGSFWLTGAETELTVDAGLVFGQPATNSIGDRVWFDVTDNDVQDANEAGISGVTVTLYDNAGNVVATTVTDANGNYLFTGLPANTNYSVGITPPAGMILTSNGTVSTGNTTTNNDFSSTTYRTAVFSSGPAGTQITGIDAGLVQQTATTASLGDKVWLDLNNNGVQDAGEPGIAGVTVNLYRDANGDGVINGAEATTPYATTVTDAFGNYIFNNLPAAAGTGTKYQAGFVLPSGYTFTTVNAGTDDYKDSDANTLPGGLTGIYTLNQGQRNMTVDAGLVQTAPAGTASLGDKVWFDADADGVQDAGETGVTGVTVTLYNNLGVAIATTTTDANGNYLFANLAAGDYSVGFSNLPQEYSLTPVWSSNDANATNSDANPATARTGTITLSAGENELDVDAGLVAGVPSGLGSLGNKVWWDVVTNNNVQDAGEPGVPGVTVNLYRDANGDGLINGAEASTPFATTVTNALGEYMFTGLAAGTYQVGFTNLPTGSSTVTQNSGTNDAIDSDGSAVVNATSGSVSTTGLYTLATGEENLTVDLGIINTAKGSLGNRVWFDNGSGGGTANDGIQNGTEQGVSGVMVTLTNAAGQLVDRNGNLTTTPVVTTTDANGNYVFADLAAGVAFAVKFSNLPAGFGVTAMAGAGGADDNRSDGNLTNYQTPAVTIVANTNNPNLDLGIISTRAALGNYVWMDDDGDGVQDAGEPGVAGVTVTLYRPGFGPDGIAGNGDDALPVASMITDQNGQYLFSNLVAGTYEVEFSTIPGGTTFTQRNTPGDNGDNTNSDAVPVTGNPSVGRTTGIVLSAGETDLTVDAGLFKPRAVIGNYVWVDSNNDGVQQATEPPASGIVVSLIDAGGNVVAIAVTDANGNYLFPNVAPGTYSMSFTNLPAGTSFTTANTGDDNLDSDVVGTTITGIVVTATTTNLSYDAGIVGFITLPVRLEFTAIKSGGNAVLTWTVSAESGVRSYTLQRSANGQQYTDMVTYSADGRTDYNRTDIQPLKGINYYRVRIENLDGSVSYSDVKVLRFAAEGLITVFPNPATDNVHIQLPEEWQGRKVTIEVISQSGQRVILKTKANAAQVEAVNISHLATGVYNLRITGQNGEAEIRKIQKF